jgi:hypothetical protein
VAWSDGVPWAIGGGAEHGAEMARLLAWAAIGGQEGVFSSVDLQVQALAVPGAGIRVLPGSCGILNRALNASKEAYLQRLFTQDEVATNPTGAGGGRSDLVIASVENPTISGEPWPIPPDIAHGPYIFTRVLENVGSGVKSVHALNLGYSAITLARIDYPASTGTVTQAMIKDLRTVVNPLTGGTQPADDGGGEGPPGDPPPVVCPGGGGDDGDNDDGDLIPANQTTSIPWPFTANWDIQVPDWATHFDAKIEVKGVQIRLGSLGGFLGLLVDGLLQHEARWRCDWPGATTRQTLPLVLTNKEVPVAWRGTTRHWHLTNRMLSGLGAGRLISTQATTIVAEIHFKQRPEVTT